MNFFRFTIHKEYYNDIHEKDAKLYIVYIDIITNKSIMARRSALTGYDEEVHQGDGEGN